MSSSLLMLLSHVEKNISELSLAMKTKSIRKMKTAIEKLEAFYSCLKSELPENFVKSNFADFDRHLHFVIYFLEKRDFGWMKSNFLDIKDRDLPSIKTKIQERTIKQKTPEEPKKEISQPSKNVFIVHGTSHEPIRELKEMLSNFGLNPIILHEQPSGSRTIIEKLEKYSDVGYAFVILTPDDVGGPSKDRRILRFEGKERARQNVVLEFGYFMGFLGRDRVCCLYTGDIELPSDMQGIVYVPFKDSIKELRNTIIKELKEADYEIKIKN